MKIDSQLQRDVMEELRWEPKVDPAHIGVTAKNGVVTLTGSVPNYSQKLAAEAAARRVAGVKAIAEEIEVRFVGDPPTSDPEIAQRIVNMLKWDVDVPDDIQVKVEHGRVTLTGEVDWNYQKAAAAKQAGRVAGVKSVTNMIAMKPKVSPTDVRQRIMSAFTRSSALDANALDIAVEGGTVKLSGTVRGWNERKIAENAAWAAPGVTKVKDEIMLAY
jgi:osmotically-inducible protein OsmY